MAFRLAFFEMISEDSLLITSTSKIEICRDKKDNMILELAIEAQADAIISNDIDLLVLHPFQNIQIINASDFLTWN